MKRLNVFMLRRPGKKEARQNKEFWRSNSLPLSRRFSLEDGDPSITFFDDTNIQIIVSSNHIPSLSHEQTPVEATSAAASPNDHENTGVNEMTPQDDESSLKRELYAYALRNMWHRAQAIYDKFPDMVRIPLTASGDTALHVAVSANRTTFVQELVNLEHMTPEDLKIPNTDGNTAFCIAAISGIGDCFQIMIEKNEDLPVIPGHDGMLPVHLAALTGHHKIVEELSSENLLEKMASKDGKYIERLFFMSISSSMYGVATKLFEKYPANLAIARDDEEKLTALHMLARKPSVEFYIQEDNNKEVSSGRSHQLQLFKKIWSHVRGLEYKKSLELITEPSAVLFDAVKSGNVDAVKWLLYMNRELLMIKDSQNNGWSLFHFAVFHRQNSIFDFILQMGTVNLIIRAVDKDHNNVLHLAARQPQEVSSSLRPNIQMQRELVWFKEVEKRVPAELRTMRNSKGKTPKDIFHANHRKLSDEVKDAAKGIANSGMLVATLISTVVFAAALTVPGDKTNAWFIVFILTNAVALFTSSASIISFLSIFTSSRFTESEFIISLHPSLILGLTLLFISIATMVIAFAAACFLIFDHTSKWVSYVVASLGLLPIFMFLVLQFSLFDGLLDYFFWTRYYRVSKAQ